MRTPPNYLHSHFPARRWHPSLSTRQERVSKVGSKAGIVAKSGGPGKYILIAVCSVVVAVIAYAAWQTLRADDELWVADDMGDVESLNEL